MKSVLFLGAHPDDIEFGASGFLLKISKRMRCFVLVMSDCEEQPGNKGITQEFKRSMETMGIERKNHALLDIPNTKFPENTERIRKSLEEYRERWEPDIVVTHCLENTHQDHKTLTEEALRVFRNCSILMYEDAKSTPGFAPNLIIGLNREELDKKIEVLECYKTQFRRYYFDMDYVRSLAKVRGKQMNLEYGEGFKVHQFVW